MLYLPIQSPIFGDSPKKFFCQCQILATDHFSVAKVFHYRPYSIRIISTLEAIQHPLFTMVITPLDAILSSRTSVALVWYCIWRIFTENCDVTMVMVLQMVENSFATDYKRYEINSVNKVYTVLIIMSTS